MMLIMATFVGGMLLTAALIGWAQVATIKAAGVCPTCGKETRHVHVDGGTREIAEPIAAGEGNASHL